LTLATYIAQLIAPGSSLGGARPKANYRTPNGSAWIAKFPSRTDRRDVSAWEHVYAQLARAAGIDVPETELLDVAGPARTFATRRFDRTTDGRRLYASALTLTGRITTEGADYADIARAITANVAAASVRDDLAQLYRRMTFNVLAGNRDDHMRNHGFLRTATGWRLAPAFDMNPAREMREHATAVNGRAIAPSATDVLAAGSTSACPRGRRAPSSARWPRPSGRGAKPHDGPGSPGASRSRWVSRSQRWRQRQISGREAASSGSATCPCTHE